MHLWFSTQPLDSRIWEISEPRHREGVRSYLILGDEAALLWDTGMGVGDIAAVVRAITDLPVTAVLSHADFDHVGGAAGFASVLAADHPRIRRAQRGYSAAALGGTYALSGFVDAPEGFDPAAFFVKPFGVARHLKEGDVVDLAPFSFRVVAAPGHAPESICLYDEASGLLLAGDALYDGPIYVSDPAACLATFRKLAALAPRRILPAHNGSEFPPDLLPGLVGALERRPDLALGETSLVRGRLGALGTTCWGPLPEPSEI